MQLRAGAVWTLWDGIGRAPQGRLRLPGGTWERSTTGAGPRTGLRGPGRLNSLRHLDYWTGCTWAGPSLGRTPGRAHPPLEPPGYVTLQGCGPEQRLGGPEDSEQLEPAGQAERGDSILQRMRHANVHLRVWGLEPTRR